MGLSICPSVSIQIKSVSRLGFPFLVRPVTGGMNQTLLGEHVHRCLHQPAWILLLCRWLSALPLPSLSDHPDWDQRWKSDALQGVDASGSRVLRCSQRSFHSFSAWAPLSMAVILWWLTTRYCNPLTPPVATKFFILSLAVATIFCFIFASKNVAFTTRVLVGQFATAAGWWIYK